MTQSSSGGATPRSALNCPEARISLGVYVLGAIDPAERTLVDTHLATCRECRDELAGLAGLPALLARVSTEEAIALAAADGPSPLTGAWTMPEPPRELLATVLDLTAARRRRRRWRDAGLAVAAAAIVAAGVLGGLRLGSSPAQQPTAGQAQNLYVGPQNGPTKTVTGQSAGMTATVGYTSMRWGTQLDAKVKGIPVGTNCQLWVIDTSGHRALAGNWVTDNLEGTVWYPGSTALPSEDIAAFQVTVGQGQGIQVQA
ncbi:MAG TPA: zf-HC2 domain-containing protein [Trebonia sp.]|nr:zf-HC2 domain-containing protein [Trebonia sp.]